jgi:hypothetical protein
VGCSDSSWNMLGEPRQAVEEGSEEDEDEDEDE